MRISARATLIPLVLFGLAACSDDSESSSSTESPTTAAPGESTPTAPTGGVTIAGFGFNTGDGVTAGEAFTITNDDPASHTFTDVGGAFSVSLSGGQEVTLTIDEPGTYEVVCQIHSSMSGTLTVN